jgi:hypothetical protein
MRAAQIRRRPGTADDKLGVDRRNTYRVRLCGVVTSC